MSFWGEKVSRRDFLSFGIIATSSFAGAGAATFIFRRLQERQQPQFSFDTSIISDENMGEAASQIEARVKDFPLVDLPSLEEITSGEDLSFANQPSLVDEAVLSTNGIRSFRLAKRRGTGTIVALLQFAGDTRFGDAFSHPSGRTPWPGFIFLFDRSTVRVFTPSRYEYTWKNPNVDVLEAKLLGYPLEDLEIAFPISEKSIGGNEFVLHLNAGLLRASDKEVSFTVPARFRLQPDNLPPVRPA